MLHLIEKLLPAPIHRALLPVAFRIRHGWRRWRKVDLAGCAVVISNLTGGVLLVRHSYGPKVWSLPGGGIDRGEDPEIAIRREVEEELGMTLGQVELLEVAEERVSGSQHKAYLFASTSSGRPKPDEREVIEARYFPSHSLPEPLGRITRARIEIWRKRGGKCASQSSES